MILYRHFRGAHILQIELDSASFCYYGNNMKSQELKVSRIGNSRGIRLPAETLKRYGIGSGLIMEERLEGTLLKPLASSGGTLSLEESAREMASASEDWDQWDGVAFDGLDGLPWQAEDAAEPSPGYAEGARNAGESRKG